MTAQVQVADESKLQASGLDDYLLKPFQPEELFQKITQYQYTQ
ncbi:MAG: hypothetical protein R2795_10030 [Saprospiraceae bacterium]